MRRGCPERLSGDLPLEQEDQSAERLSVQPNGRFDQMRTVVVALMDLQQHIVRGGIAKEIDRTLGARRSDACGPRPTGRRRLAGGAAGRVGVEAIEHAYARTVARRAARTSESSSAPSLYDVNQLAPHRTHA